MASQNIPEIQISKIKKNKDKLISLPGTHGKVKKFNKKLHDKYDITARQIVKNMLGAAIKDNDDVYGEDMIFTIEDFPFRYLEVQVCAKWKNDYPFDRPFVYSRKMKFSQETLFITFNSIMSKAILFSRRRLIEKPERLQKYARETVNFVEWRHAIKITTDQLTPRIIREYSGEFVDSDDDTDPKRELSEDSTEFQ